MVPVPIGRRVGKWQTLGEDWEIGPGIRVPVSRIPGFPPRPCCRRWYPEWVQSMVAPAWFRSASRAAISPLKVSSSAWNFNLLAVRSVSKKWTEEASVHLPTRQFGSQAKDSAQAVVVDGNGNIYIAGWTLGDMGGRVDENRHDADAFLTLYDSSGTHIWTRQFGTAERDEAWGVGVDRQGNVYVVGRTFGVRVF